MVNDSREEIPVPRSVARNHKASVRELKDEMEITRMKTKLIIVKYWWVFVVFYVALISVAYYYSWELHGILYEVAKLFLGGLIGYFIKVLVDR